MPDRVVTLLGRPDRDLDQRGLKWLTTVTTREAWRQGSTARELPAGAFIATDLAAGVPQLEGTRGRFDQCFWLCRAKALPRSPEKRGYTASAGYVRRER